MVHLLLGRQQVAAVWHSGRGFQAEIAWAQQDAAVLFAHSALQRITTTTAGCDADRAEDCEVAGRYAQAEAIKPRSERCIGSTWHRLHPLLRWRATIAR